LYQPKEIHTTGNYFSSFGHTWFNKHGGKGLNDLEVGCLNEGEVRQHANHDEDLDDSGLFEGNEPLFPPNVLRLEDITDQEVRGFDDGEVLQRVHNVDQMLRDIEFQRVYTPSELARLKQSLKIQRNPSILIANSTLAFLVI
jgi:hypothetical protein